MPLFHQDLHLVFPFLLCLFFLYFFLFQNYLILILLSIFFMSKKGWKGRSECVFYLDIVIVVSYLLSPRLQAEEPMSHSCYPNLIRVLIGFELRAWDFFQMLSISGFKLRISSLKLLGSKPNNNQTTTPSGFNSLITLAKTS